MNRENFNKSKTTALKMRRLSLFMGILLLLSAFAPAIFFEKTAARQPGEKIADIASRTYHSATNLVKWVYHTFLDVLIRILSWFKSLYIRTTAYIGISPTALKTVFKVLVLDFFVVMSKFVKGGDLIISLINSALIVVLVAINFVMVNFISQISIFLTNITILTPEYMVDYWHDFIFNFMEGFSDPWATLVVIWPHIEYYQGILTSISDLGSAG